MNAKTTSTPRRARQTLAIEASRAAPRDHVARAMGLRASGAGKHARSQGALRRAGRVALQRLLGRDETDD